MSSARFARYLNEAGGDRALALEWYEWNSQLGQAMMRDVGHFEVALRNIYNETLTARWHGAGHWLFDPKSPVNAPLVRTSRKHKIDMNTRNRSSVAEAVARCGGRRANPDAVVAELNFGSWRHLSDAIHEKSLWVPYLHHAWPKKTQRHQIDAMIGAINDQRNRIAHHEPLFAQPLSTTGIIKVQQGIATLLGMLIPELAAHVQRTSTVAAVLAAKPK
ncbi:MAG: Abi family protein [Bifidobacteriaceae bacterium]|nr:Abi family protein [Bifidobacteriaceae bacterium]